MATKKKTSSRSKAPKAMDAAKFKRASVKVTRWAKTFAAMLAAYETEAAKGPSEETENALWELCKVGQQVDLLGTELHDALRAARGLEPYDPCPEGESDWDDEDAA